MTRRKIRLPSPPSISHRLASWGWDYLVILGWLLLVFLLVGLPQILDWIDLTPVWTDQNSADAGITILTVLPYFAYLFLTELKRPHATWGKRKAGIVVAGRDEAPLRGGSVLIRNLVKVMPWQLGHMGTMRLATTSEVTTTAIALEVSSLTLLALIVVPIFLRRRGVHDLLAGTQVTTTRGPGTRPAIPSL